MSNNTLCSGPNISLRKILASDLGVIAHFAYSVSMVEPHSDPQRLAELHAATNLWQDEAGAVAIISNLDQRLLGTLQFYRSAPCIHGLEIGYLVHNPKDRRQGFAGEALRLLSDLLFQEQPTNYRQQLLIEVWNTASWKVAEKAGFIREGILRSCGFGQGDPADCFIYSRTEKDYRQALASANGPG